MTPSPLRMLRPRECAKALGVSLTTLWRWTKVPGFPVAFRLGPNSIAFSEAEIQSWLAGRRVAAAIMASVTPGASDRAGVETTARVS